MSDKIEPEVELRMRHVLYHLQATVRLASGHQLQRVLIRHQSVFRPMDYQQRTLYLLAILLIVKTLLDHSLGTASIQILRYFFKRDERTQQNSTMYRIFLSDSQCNRTSYRPSKQNDLIACQFVRLQKLYDSGRIFLYILGCSLPLVNAISPILHRQHRILCLQTHKPDKIVCRADVFSVGVKKHNDFRLGASQKKARDKLITTYFFFHVEIPLQRSDLLILGLSLRI